MRLIAIVAVLALGLLRLSAQTTTTSFLVLDTFTTTSGQPGTNDDGAYPAAGLILSGNTLYGTTTVGGSGGYGTIFEVDTDGSNFDTLYSFTNGVDGATPMAPLLLADGVLYGTAGAGGGSDYGTVFAISVEGTNFSTLYTFTNGTDGARPEAGLLLAGSTLYGTTTGTMSGSSYGSVFMLNTNSSGFGVLHRFSAPVSGINNDGFLPSGALILQGEMLYGATFDGGRHGTGTLFEAATNGLSFDTVYSFAAVSAALANASGAYPQGGLVASGNALYGAAHFGGTNGYGTIFMYAIADADFSPIYTFTGGEDYINPQGPLTLSSNLLYGTTAETIFSVTTNGAEFTDIFSTNNADGFAPNGGLSYAGQSFFGTTQDSGTNEVGMVFDVSTVPSAIPLTIQQVPSAVILTWSNPAFVLQSAPALTGPFTNVAGATSPYTYPVTGPQTFFRLQAN
jgi:uncharacterized repeat protein (TIGR03803 family)